MRIKRMRKNRKAKRPEIGTFKMRELVSKITVDRTKYFGSEQDELANLMLKESKPEVVFTKQ